MANLSNYHKIVNGIFRFITNTANTGRQVGGSYFHSKKHLFRGDRKYLSLVFIMIILLLLIGLITPILVEYKKDSWVDTLEIKKNDIKDNCITLFKDIEEALLDRAEEFVVLLKEESKKLSESESDFSNGSNKQEVERSEIQTNKLPAIVESEDQDILKGQYSIAEGFDFESGIPGLIGDYSFELYDSSGNLILWNSRFTPTELFKVENTGDSLANISDLKETKQGEPFFVDNPLRSFLVCKLDIKLRNSRIKKAESTYYLFFAQQFEKKYTLTGNEIKNDREVNAPGFSQKLTDYFNTDIQIKYGQKENVPIDGRFFSFELRNKTNKPIGIINAAVPTLSSSINSFKETILDIQTVIILLAFVFLVLGVRTDFKSIKYESLKILLFFVFTVIMRILLLSLNIPAKLLFIRDCTWWEDLSDPSYFSSTLGGGIVKSPIELFVSSILFLIFGIYLYAKVKRFSVRKSNSAGKVILYLGLAVGTVIVNLAIIRSFAASVKSIIFDSSIEYFSDADIIPDFINFFVNSSVLILASGFIIILIVFLHLGLKLTKGNHELIEGIVRFLKRDNRSEQNEIPKNKSSFFVGKETIFRNIPGIILVFLYAIGSVFYIHGQNEPLISYFLLILILVLIWFLTIRLNRMDKSVISGYMFLAVISSVIGITLMNYFNETREKESFAVVANEINRKNENLLNFLTVEALLESRKSEEVTSYLKSEDSDFNALAFRIWVNSAMSRENIFSAVSILNKKKKVIGSFSNGIPETIRVPQIFEVMPVNELKTMELKNPLANSSMRNNGSERLRTDSTVGGVQSDYIVGIIPMEYPGSSGTASSSRVQEKSNILGYISVSLMRGDDADFSAGTNALWEPLVRQLTERWSNHKSKFSEISNVSIFEIVNGRSRIIKSEFNLSRHFASRISKADYDEEGKVWLNFQINGTGYVIFAVKSNDGGQDRIVVVAQKDKEYVWNLFNFFKLFSIHALFILLLGIVLLLNTSLSDIAIWLRRQNPSMSDIVSSIKSIAVRVGRSRIINIKGMSFKSQLLLSFLIISLIPMIALAIYNRQNVAVKGDNLIISELRDNTSIVKKHIRTQLRNNPGRDVLTAAEKAKNELGISFSVYKDAKLIFTTSTDLRKANVISGIMDPNAYNSLVYKGVNEEILDNSFEGIRFKTYFNRTKIAGEYYFFEVNSLFNVVHNPFSTVEIDVFLFGTYSLGVILIIFISTLLANKISSPIRRLTTATKAVAMGDLSIKIEQAKQGELKDLIDGFNYMTDEIKKNQEELAEVERETAWREMAKQVAHEIKNPLTPMKLNIQHLVASYKDGETDPERAKNFGKLFEKVTKIILQQIETLSQIASEFSRFARMPGLNLSKVDLIAVCEEVRNLYSEEEIEVNLKIKSNLKNVENPGSSLVIEADDNNLRRMLINLIRNSIQANASKVVLELNKSENNILLSVTDNGSGIPSDIQAMIFNPHFSTKKSGMGLGLKLAKRFMESIGGTISLVKSDEKGTVFVIRFVKL